MRYVTVLKSELKTYRDLDEFLWVEEHKVRFKEIYEFTPTRNYIKRHLKSNKNFTTDVEIVERILESFDGTYVVGEWFDSWENSNYAMQSCGVIWVHRLTE